MLNPIFRHISKNPFFQNSRFRHEIEKCAIAGHLATGKQLFEIGEQLFEIWELLFENPGTMI